MLVASSVIADAGDVLRQPERHGEQAEQQAHGHAGQRRQQHAGPEVRTLVDGEPADHGPQGHDPLDAEIEHAGPLAQQLAQGGEDQRRGDPQRGGPEARLEEDVEGVGHRRSR